ncbi:GNAT family N-acetyltransferase [Bacillus shivajii]|uniref:GNAT family N-acetyltransferase n=1 Tax=Bacillus shivajii TaxID=1983719 RepID=UPI001CF95647|nr:GNAT family protein [Bacillus shivajii]UCZ54246.1 GNAT family N-acetyltransferase [Bacillus shivajii]
MFYHIINEDLQLEVLQEKHEEALFQLTDSSREYLGEWLPWVPYTKTVDDTKSFIRSTLKSFGEQKSLSCAIIFKGEIAGIVAYHEIDRANEKTSIGYWLGEKFQGYGIMTKAVEALVYYAFEELKLNRIEIHAGLENKKSRDIPRRLSFQEEGVLRQAEKVGNRYVDHVVYSLLKEEWVSLLNSR